MTIKTAKTQDIPEDKKATVSELDTLKQQADMLGIEYASNVTIKALKVKITEYLKDDSVEDKNQQIKDAKADNMKLVRVIITPIDSAKRDYSSQFFSVGNDVIGTISRVTPFNEEWMIEEILAKHIESLMFQYLVPKEIGQREVVDTKLVKAYNVVRLPNPTKEEIDELAKRQSARDDTV